MMGDYDISRVSFDHDGIFWKIDLWHAFFQYTMTIFFKVFLEKGMRFGHTVKFPLNPVSSFDNRKTAGAVNLRP